MHRQGAVLPSCIRDCMPREIKDRMSEEKTGLLKQRARCTGTRRRRVAVPGLRMSGSLVHAGFGRVYQHWRISLKIKTGNPQKHDRKQAHGVSRAGSVSRQNRHHSPSVRLFGTKYRTCSGRRDFISSSGVLNGSSSSQYLPRSSGQWESDPTDTGFP